MTSENKDWPKGSDCPNACEASIDPFYGDRTLDDQDNLEDFIEHAFALEVIMCSLDEIETLGDQPLSCHQQVARHLALSYAGDVFEFVVREGVGNWGLKSSEVTSGLKRRWHEYLDFLSPSDASPRMQQRRKFIEGWMRVYSAAVRSPAWLSRS